MIGNRRKRLGSTYGGYAIGHGCLGGDYFDSSPKGVELIARVMNIAGVECFNNMKDRYIRVALKRNEPIKIIGHIIRDEWFDIKSFF